jgi:cupin 2 domain-containing protein
MANLFEAIPATLPNELIERLAEGAGVRIERIVSEGHASSEGFWYDQPENEWVVLLSGSATLLVEEGAALRRVELCAGDYLLIPAHQRHRVKATAKGIKSVWLAIFFEGDVVR